MSSEGLINENRILSADSLNIESEKIYHNLLERMPDGVYKSTPEGKFVEVNRAMVEMLGYDSKEELMAIDIKNELYFKPEDRESLVLQEKYEEIGVFRLKKKDGSELWVEDHGWYIRDENGKILFHEGIVRDITKRRIAEDLVRKSEERFKLLFDQAPMAYQSIDESGNILDINETWHDLFGFSKSEVLGRWFGDFLNPASIEKFRNGFESFKKTGKINEEFEILTKNNELVSIQMEGRLSNPANSKETLIYCVLSNITERKQNIKAITEERILLRTLIDNIPDSIYVKDAQGRKIISNKADLDFLGIASEKEMIGKTDLEIFPPDFAYQTFSDDLSVINTAQSIINKIEIIPNKNGSKRYLSTSKVPLINEAGKVIGLIGVGHDITKTIQTEQKLIQLSKGIEQSTASVIITDTDGNIEYVNKKLLEITGYTFEDVKGKNPRIFQSGRTSKEEYKKLWNLITAGNEYRGEIQNMKRNGEIFWESVLISPIRDEENNIINYMAFKEDITNRKKSELEIKKLSVAIDQNPAAVVITNTQGRIEYVNRKFLECSGYEREELLGKIIRILKPGHVDNETFVEIWNHLFAGLEWKGEHQNRNKNGNKYWESVQISAIKNSEGRITNYVIMSEDISERKKMEKDLIMAKEKAVESDRLKSAFLANMSHEIRTPLNSILGFSDLLTDPHLSADSRREFAELINISGNNLLSIINDVLDISKIEAGQIVLNEFEIVAQSLVSHIHKEYTYKANSKGIEFNLAADIPEPLIYFRSDEMRIKQVLINFVGNAIKFTSEGYIEIGVKLVNDQIQFHVKDTGIGIAPEFHSQVFDRFRQVEAAHTRKYGGNGLGLAITKNLAELLGGKIWLESVPDQGSTFYFSLPASYLIN